MTSGAAKVYERLSPLVRIAIGAAVMPLLCGCLVVPVLAVGAPTKLTLRPSSDPTESMTVGLRLVSAFRYSGSELEAIAIGTYPREHETYLTWMVLAPSEPALDFKRAIRICCQVPSEVNLKAGRAERLDCRVDLVLAERHDNRLPEWVAGAYSGTVAAVVRFAGRHLYVDLPETELPCVAGGVGPLRVSGRVVVPEGADYLDSDREWFARLEARASGQPEVGSEQP